MIGRFLHVYRKFHTDWLLNNAAIMAANDRTSNNNNIGRKR